MSVAAVRGRRPSTQMLEPLLPAAAVAVVLGVWQWSGSFLSPILISTPTRIAQDLVELFARGVIFSPLAESLEELVIGGSVGILAGIALGVLMGRYEVVDKVLSPFVNFLNATPLVVIIPLVIIWVGISQNARLLFIFLITLWPVLLNTLAGMRNVNRGYVDVGAAFGLSETQMLRKITLPAAVPFILAGIRISAGLAIIGMIVSEMEVSLTGLGYLLVTYGNSFFTGRLLAVVFLSSMFGVANVLLVKWIQASFFPWIAGAAADQR
ncbi:MAG: ABC transporter permease [Chloroflexota bacterium]|nr:ABC transporter permease [Chloroflexota bacterium]MDE3192198.1 ABC transporter permease [Chloroflexota bacterium]